MTWVIAVHGGAGYHSTKETIVRNTKRALRSACKMGTEKLKKGSSSSRTEGISTLEDTICVLENEEILNAGTGSNLTYDGTVECDASIMEGCHLYFGSVSAVEGVKNPIKVAKGILDNSSVPQPLGRVTPITLVGRGAYAFAKEHGIETVDPKTMITERARGDWQKWKSRLNNDPNDANLGDLSTETDTMVQDTVGSVVCDDDGHMSAGVSSGGLLMKYPGRMGEAAMFGAGVWAYSPPGVPKAAACSVSGTGEDIMRYSLARRLVERVVKEPLEHIDAVLKQEFEAFSDQCTLFDREPSGGVLLLIKEAMSEDFRNESVALMASPEYFGTADSKSMEDISKKDVTKLRLWCAFTTQSMSVGFQSSEMAKPKAMVLRRPISVPSETTSRHPVVIVSLPLSD